MGLFDGITEGLGRGLGAAAQGYLTGENKGEAEAYRRQQQQALLLAKLAAAHQQKQGKEQLPYEVQSLIDTRNRIFGPTGTAEERKQWNDAGSEHAFQLTMHALAQYGPDAARTTLAIANAPEGTDTTGLQEHLSSQIEQPAPAPRTGAGWAGGGTWGLTPPQGGAGGTSAARSFVQQVQPSVKPNFDYTPSAHEQADTAYKGAQTGRIQALTPYEVAFKKAQTADIGHRETLEEKQFNLQAAQHDFDNAMAQAKYLTSLGTSDFQQQSRVYSDLLNAAGRLHLNGGDPSQGLKSLLFVKGPLGQQSLNAEAASRYLAGLGFDQADIQAIIKGAGTATGIFGGEQGGAPAAPSGAAPSGGGPPVLPPVGGPGGEPLQRTMGFVQSLGFTPTSTTGGQHNPGSLHYQGRAIDVSVRGKSPQEVEQFKQMAAAQGYTVRDERSRPPGQAVWSGPHIHLEWPAGGPQGGSPTTAAEAAGSRTPPVLAPFSQNFNTILTPEEQKRFVNWKARYAPHDSGYDYDLQGAFKAGFRPDPRTGHWPDQFKKPNHPTFSDESQYAPYGKPGHWQGETYIPPSSGTAPAPAFTTAGAVPSARGTGVATPATAAPVKNPFSPKTLEGQVFDLYTKGQITAEQLQQKFHGTPYERAVAGVIDQANAMQRRNLFTGVPVPSRLGAEMPNRTNFAGTLGYPGAPTISTSPVPEPTAGFGAPKPEVRVNVPPVATGAPGGTPAASTGKGAPASKVTATASGPKAAGKKPPAEETKVPPGKGLIFPKLKGTALAGMAKGAPPLEHPVTTAGGEGTSVFGFPKKETVLAPNESATVKIPPELQDRAEAQFRQGLQKAAMEDVARYRKQFEFAPAVERLLKARGIHDPDEQRSVYAFVQNKVRQLYQQGVKPAQVKQRVQQELQAELRRSRGHAS